MTQREIEQAISDVLTGRKAELVLYTGDREALTIYEREIGFYSLRPVGRVWALQVEGFPNPIFFEEARAR